VKQERGAAPTWFQPLLCMHRISTKQVGKKKTITVPFPSKSTSFGYHNCRNQSFLDLLLARLDQQLVWRQCPSTSVPVPVPEALVSQIPAELGRLQGTFSATGCDTPGHRRQGHLEAAPRDQASLAGAVVPVRPAGLAMAPPRLPA